MFGLTKTAELWGTPRKGLELFYLMQITFWGVRGSYPVPGAATVRYGGQTSCVETRTAGGHTILADAGTGRRALGNKLYGEAPQPQHYHVLLSHVHWDHIQGLP